MDAERELAATERGLKALEEEQAAAVRAQIAGIMAGASPEAYAAVFADIAARRQEMGERWEFLRKAGSRLKPKAASGREAEVREAALRDVYAVLSSPDVDGSAKRKAVGNLVARVVCQKGGADVAFHPGVICMAQSQEHSQAARAETILSVLTAWASYLGL